MRRLKENENCVDAITFNIRLLVSNRFTLHFQVYLTVEMIQNTQTLQYINEIT